LAKSKEMTYEIFVTQKAEDDLKKFDPVVKKRIKNGLIKLSSNPRSFAKKLVGSNEYRFRVGSYRVVFDIQGKNILILRIGHRREIYR